MKAYSYGITLREPIDGNSKVINPTTNKIIVEVGKSNLHTTKVVLLRMATQKMVKRLLALVIL